MEKQKNSFYNFFIYFAFGFAMSSLKVNLVSATPYEIVSNILLNILYNFANGILTGLGAMGGIDIYNYLKKNSNYECQDCR
jgi:accessory gene regulator protein AgrB